MENKQLEQGEQVAPYEGADKLHIEVHAKRMKESGFKDLEIEIQNSFVEHLQGEVEILKQQRQST